MNEPRPRLINKLDSRMLTSFPIKPEINDASNLLFYISAVSSRILSEISQLKSFNLPVRHFSYISKFM